MQKLTFPYLYIVFFSLFIVDKDSIFFYRESASTSKGPDGEEEMKTELISPESKLRKKVVGQLL